MKCTEIHPRCGGGKVFCQHPSNIAHKKIVQSLVDTNLQTNRVDQAKSMLLKSLLQTVHCKSLSLLHVLQKHENAVSFVRCFGRQQREQHELDDCLSKEKMGQLFCDVLAPRSQSKYVSSRERGTNKEMDLRKIKKCAWEAVRETSSYKRFKTSKMKEPEKCNVSGKMPSDLFVFLRG